MVIRVKGYEDGEKNLVNCSEKNGREDEVLNGTSKTISYHFFPFY